MDSTHFLQVYMKHLLEAKKRFPDQYEWTGVDALDVFRRVAESFRNGTYCRQSLPIKLTCKELKVPYTREAINRIFETK